MLGQDDAATPAPGVSVELLAALDLGPEITGMQGRQLRMRRFTFAPGAIFGPVHEHKDRPGLVYVLQGTITDHRAGIARDYGPGAGWPEEHETMHWLENRGTLPAIEISVDVVRLGEEQIAPSP
ncbi:MAG: cupin [Actinomycetota bacterium]|nr:cupin [Actinomycetota bacterium]